MSTTTGEVRPENLPATVPNYEPAAPAAAPAAPPAPLPDDPDDRALAEARAAVDAQPQAAGDQPSPPVAPSRKDTRIPKSRLDEANAERRRLADENAYLRGVIDARKTPAPTPQDTPPAPAQQNPLAPMFQEIERLIHAEQSKVASAAAQFDQGELSMVQFKDIEFKANQVIASLRERAVIATVGQNTPRPQVSLADQDILARHLAEMERLHPWCKMLTNAELAFLADHATREFAALGRPIGSSPQETIRLRQRVAELSTKFGPDWYPGRAPAVPAPAPAPVPATQPPAAEPPRGQAGRDKLNLASNHPPNLNKAGTAAEGETITAARVATMTTEEISALPPQVRQRILQG